MGGLLAGHQREEAANGSGVAFEHRGFRELKGLPGDWRLYAVKA